MSYVMLAEFKAAIERLLGHDLLVLAVDIVLPVHETRQARSAAHSPATTPELRADNTLLPPITQVAPATFQQSEPIRVTAPACSAT
jgi:hypothetical protein